MIGGTIIENAIDVQPDTLRAVRRLWCYSEGEGECAVWAEIEEAQNVKPGDTIWWQSGKIMWSGPDFEGERTISKIGYSFYPRCTQE
jgi:hypothetical protein